MMVTKCLSVLVLIVFSCCKANMPAVEELYGFTPLQSAVYQLNKEEVEKLLEQEVDVNAKDNFKRTALHIAVVPKIVEQADQKDVPGIYKANGKKMALIMEDLIKHGAMVDAQEDFGGNTPLHIAAQHAHLGAAQWLLVHGADINKRDNDGRTPLLTAAFPLVPNPKIVMPFIEMLLEKNADVNARDKTEKTPLHWAAMADLAVSSLIIKELIKHKAQIDPQDFIGWTPLFYAVPDFKSARELIDHGANIFAKAKDNSTLLHRGPEEKLLIELVAKGLDINARNDGGETPLMSTIRAHRYKNAEAFIDQGADVNAQDNTGNSPLHILASLKETGKNSWSLVKALVKHEADLSLKNKAGKTPFDLATDPKLKEMLKIK